MHRHLTSCEMKTRAMEDAARTGPIIDWSWLRSHIAARVRPGMDIFTMPAREQLLPSTLPVIAIFRLCTGPRGRQNVPAMAACQRERRLPGQYAIYC